MIFFIYNDDEIDSYNHKDRIPQVDPPNLNGDKTKSQTNISIILIIISHSLPSTSNPAAGRRPAGTGSHGPGLHVPQGPPTWRAPRGARPRPPRGPRAAPAAPPPSRRRAQRHRQRGLGTGGRRRGRGGM